MQLADGTRVYYAENILPVVPKGSPSAVAAERSESKRTTAGTLQGIAFAGIVIGTGVVVAPILSRDSGEEFSPTPLYVGAGLVLASGILFFIGRSFRSDSHDEAATAFEMYDAGLRQHLGLCSAQDPKCLPIRSRAQISDGVPRPTDGEPKPVEPQQDKPIYKPSSGPFGTD